MNRNLYNILPILGLLSCLAHDIQAIKYVVKNTVPNTPGGQLFENDIGVYFTIAIMQDITKFIHKVFQQRNLADRRRVPVLTVFISEFPGYAYKNGSSVNVSA